MSASEFRKLSEQQLQDELTALRREQFNLRMQRGSGQAVKTHLFSQIRRKVAQIKTILGERSVKEV